MSCIIETKSQASLKGWEILIGGSSIDLVLWFSDGTTVTLDTDAIGQLLQAVPALQKVTSLAAKPSPFWELFVDRPRTGAADLLRDREGQS